MGEDEMEEGEGEMMSEGGESELSETDAKRLAEKQYALMHSSDGGEMGESDMDEYSFDEEGESYYENISDDGEPAPKLIPIAKATDSDRDYQSDTSESESDIHDSVLDSQELDSDEGVDQQENPHGFVYGHHLDTYKKSKKERTAEQLREKEMTKFERAQ